ncbi:dnaJ homolog subfamily C member 28-like [Littorina saxatilis]|uniref:J domain-containing protein n=1 Tax=Littorina saxatilis TaxID=31220 RepID=A0AAN9GJ45_9CAEN
MNSLARPLPLHSHWRCLSAPIANGNRVITLIPTPTGTSRHLPPHCQENGLHSLTSSAKIKQSAVLFVPSQQFHAGRRLSVEYKIKAGLEDCYSLLGVERDCGDQELKNAYLEKAKAFHPDSALPTSDPYKFSQVRDAYKVLLEHRKGRELEEEEEKEAEIIFDIKHTAPQHRQYLEFEGVGFGTPSQRQRQYQQYRIERVTENVFQHRIQKLAAETEDALVVKDKQQAKKSIISNAMDRMVEDMIQESMKRGDFNNLPGQGKPLEYSPHNPFVDTTTHNINKILVNNGFAPEWIMLQSEIRKEIHQARQTIAIIHYKLDNKSRSSKDVKMWKASVTKFNQQISEVNIKINKYNLIVPILNKQKIPYNAERELKKVLDNVEEYLTEEKDAYLAWDVSVEETPPTWSQENAKTNWGQVWQEIKTIFKSSEDKEVKT